MRILSANRLAALSVLSLVGFSPTQASSTPVGVGSYSAWISALDAIGVDYTIQLFPLSVVKFGVQNPGGTPTFGQGTVASSWYFQMYCFSTSFPCVGADIATITTPFDILGYFGDFTGTGRINAGFEPLSPFSDVYGAIGPALYNQIHDFGVVDEGSEFSVAMQPNSDNPVNLIGNHVLAAVRVPEPATVGLLGLALFALWQAETVQRKRRATTL